ncbi:hypothetical protein N7510_010976 [Penicillium lagena]|uniref:uncharacterized protein n=1 Tax=Penicillium lagena TaxID=94218 RepID=UPI0025414E02|nr:uncharacterized protein N7510_010976 [Penicillium lagena]KAJ5601442.1 hypothetical protein N7510_010976 [Penicillium lagena]
MSLFPSGRCRAADSQLFRAEASDTASSPTLKVGWRPRLLRLNLTRMRPNARYCTTTAHFGEWLNPTGWRP